MNIKPKTIYLLIAALLVIFAAYFYFVTDVGRTSEDNGNFSDVEADLSSEGELNAGDVAEIIAPVTKTTEPVPSLDVPVVFESFVSAEDRAKLSTEIEEYREKLRENKYDYNSWLDLALKYKAAGDYKSAEKAWIYASYLHPDVGLPQANLGTLYGYYFRDYTKAEESFRKAMEINPELMQYQLQLFNFFAEVLQDRAKAETELERVIGNFPEEAENLRIYGEARLPK